CHAALERRVAALEGQRLATGGGLETDVEGVQQYLLGQLARATTAGPHGEPVPVVLDDPFVHVAAERKWELMDMVARLAERTQLVYLTDDAFIGAWARRRTATGTITLLEPVDG
ncbi:MAG: hypothetical protein M3527_05105, partial [Actinomycetota bacterium]|nr:hypothetical protein [Actinomycetota bacterium]